MKREGTLLQHIRTAGYYAAIVLSVGLIWGGGMALLRGSAFTGVVAIFLGILVQVALKYYGVGEKDERGADRRQRAVRQQAGDCGKHESAERAEQTIDEVEEPPVGQRVARGRRGRGTDGATLNLDSGSHLDIRQS